MNIHPQGTALRRRDEIVRLVRETPVRSQEELQQLLSLRGIRATQPTLSRDIRELGLAKTPSGYAVPGPALAPGVERTRALERLERVMHELVLSVSPAGTLVVIKTPPAEAHPLAHAFDEASLPGAVGTIAGDDTVFVATGDVAAAEALAARLRAFLTAPPAPRRRRSG